MSGIFAEEHTCTIFGNVWAKTMIFKSAGDEKVGHIHDFDHVTLIGQGGFKIERVLSDGTIKRDIVYAPGIIHVPKGEAHSLIALEDHSIAFCVETTVATKDQLER